MAPRLPWLVFLQLEARLVEALLRSPAFHRGVQRIHKRIHRWKHGTPPEELGGTNLDVPNTVGPRRFLQLFWEELKNGHQRGPSTKK